MAKKIDNALGGYVDLDNAGNICTTGSFNYYTDFDPGPLVYSDSSLVNGGYILRLDQNGNFLSATTLQASINSLYAKDSIYVYSAGSFGDTIDFDPSPASYLLSTDSTWAAFLWKLSFCSSPVQYVTLADCDSITFSGQTFDSSGTYVMSYLNSVGCDSTIYLQLTINLSNDSLINLQSCDSVQYNGTNYTVSGMYQQTFINSYGCDSIVHFAGINKYKRNINSKCYCL